MPSNLSKRSSTKRKPRPTYHAFYHGGNRAHTSLLAKLRQDFRITESALVKNYIATLITFVRDRAKDKTPKARRPKNKPQPGRTLGSTVRGHSAAA